MFFDVNEPLADQRFDSWSKRISSELAIFCSGDERRDANETAIFARQLEYIYTTTYDVKYPEFKARTFIPLDSSVPTGAETYTYRQFDQIGAAKLIANYADDLPDVTVFGKEFTGHCRSLGSSYTYSVQEVRRAAMANYPLDANLAKVARRTIEALHDKIAAFGDASALLGGFLNNANVPIIAPITGSWDTATPDQIIADMNKLVNSIPIATNGIHIPDTLLLDIASFTKLASTPRSTVSDTTILAWYLANSPFIRNIDHWYLLDLADTDLDGPRAVAYQRSPEVLGMVVPQEFEQFPPQMENLAFRIPCHSRSGGVKMTYPLACAYMDGLSSADATE